jgi:hypothetical protein
MRTTALTVCSWAPARRRASDAEMGGDVPGGRHAMDEDKLTRTVTQPGQDKPKAPCPTFRGGHSTSP